MRNRFILGLAVVVMVGTVAATATAESLSFEGKVPYTLDKALELDAKVGPVTIHSVTFYEAEGHVGSKIMGKLRRGDEGAQGVLKLAFDGENPTRDEWEVTFHVELLDRQGKLIDRFKRSTDFEGEAKTYKTDHPILEYVLPLIHKVNISIKAKLD
jgi:hypothetical protein